MPTKKTTKLDSKISKIMEKNALLEVSSKKDDEKDKKKETKKVVVKRRKVDLKPTKASAVAIASQAAKKQALIEKLSNSEAPIKKPESSDTKIPLWVWMIFWCSLLICCVSFYEAMIRPQLEKQNVVVEDVYQVDESTEIGWQIQEVENKNEVVLWEINSEQVEMEEAQWVTVPETAIEAIDQFFARLSDRDFDGAFDLMIPALRNYNDIRTHFTSYRMNPFLDWIEWWKLVPENFKYVNSPAYWKDVYNFDLSYVLKSNQEKYEETWEFTVTTKQGSPQISSIRCITSKCSYHPIFWPENFGLMK